MKQNVFRQTPVLLIQHLTGCNVAKPAFRRSVYCIYSIGASFIAGFTASVHRVAFTAWPAQCCKRSIPTHARLCCNVSIAPQPLLHLQHCAGALLVLQYVGIATWICCIYSTPTTELLILHLQHYRWAGLAWVIGALSQKNKTIPIGIPLSLILCYRRCGSDGLEYGYT